ncbi:MAG: DUF5615 family PIN-like protein [Planctomycetota bacterium]
MKLLLDENLSPKLARALSDLFPSTLHVEDCGLGAAGDDAIWEFARTHGFAILSKDSDFCERSAIQGTPPKVIWLHVGNCTTSEIDALMRGCAAAIQAFFADPSGTCLVLTRKGVERSPPS